MLQDQEFPAIPYSRIDVKSQSWKLRVPEHDLTKEISLLAEILADPVFTGSSRHWYELSRTAGDWRSSLWSRPTKLAIHQIENEKQLYISLVGKQVLKVSQLEIPGKYGS